jgi:hypothetical protein
MHALSAMEVEISSTTTSAGSKERRVQVGLPFWLGGLLRRHTSLIELLRRTVDPEPRDLESILALRS